MEILKICDMTGETIVENRFDGRTVLVTGSTTGIGKAIAKRFAAEGAAIVVTGRTVEDGERVVEEITDAGGEATFVRGDLRRPDDIERLVTETADRYGRLDALVNNAAVQTETTATETTMADWNRVIETDFRSYWLCAKHAVEHMPHGGSIVNVSSNHAIQTTPGLFPYNAVKAGIDGMTRAMALDFGPGIRVNTVNPGYIEVPRNEATLAERNREHLEAIHPLKRIGAPNDVAGPVSFLASDDAAFITGANLLVDGGRAAVMEDDPLRHHENDSE